MVSPLSQTVDEDGGMLRSNRGRLISVKGWLWESGSIMGGLVWDDVGVQVNSPLIGLHSICQ